MNEIGKQLAQEGLDILKASKAFVVDQAPDFMRQVLAWKAAEAWVGIALSASFLLAAFGLYKALRWAMKEGEPVVAIPAGVIGVLFIIFAPCIAYDSAMTLLKIHFAPKIFLLEYFAGLVK